MTIRFFITLCAFFSFLQLVAQPVRLKLSRQVNVPSYNHYAPSLSADGMTLVYASDYYMSEGNKTELKLCQAKGMDNWGAVEEITPINKSGNLNQYGGHCLSADGNTIYFSSRKTGGVAGFDIWACEKKNGVWGAPYNLGKPLNSEGMEGFPSLAPDGKTLYFVRCQTMDNKSCEGCKIYASESKGKDLWKEAVALPSSINQANVLYPRILKDNKTLLFSSNKLGGKGGYDLYVSKKEGNTWSEPKNLLELNTAEDEIFADMSIQTDAITYASFLEGYWTLFKAKLTEELQPDPVLLFSGKVSNSDSKPVASSVQISDNKTAAPISMTSIPSGSKFAIVLPAEKEYDIAFLGGNELFYWSSSLSAVNLSKSRKEEPEVQLETVKPGKVLHGNKALFDSTSYQLLPGGNLECRRIAKFVQAHTSNTSEIVLFPSGVSVNKPSDPTAAFESMKTAIQAELAKAGLAADKTVIANGYGTQEEENNYSGWGLKLQ